MTHHERFERRRAIAGWALLTLLLGCSPAAPTQADSADLARDAPPGKLRPVPGKPGESITNTEMCSCKVCEPTSCCNELEQDAPDTGSCAEGLDFSKCEMQVSSCDARCFQHRWRTRIEVGCSGSRPDKCCHDQPEM